MALIKKRMQHHLLLTSHLQQENQIMIPLVELGETQSEQMDQE